MTDALWTADRPAPDVVVHQPRRGFRYGAEAFWLAGAVLERGVPATALDLGTGSGIVAWLLARRGVAVTGIDVRPEWQEGWARSAAASRCPAPAFRCADVASLAPADGAPVDVVVCNPPFFPAGSGPEPADPWHAAARFASSADVAAFVGAGVAWLAPGGRLVVVVPIERETDVVQALPPGWTPRRIVRVGRRRVVIEAAEQPEGPQGCTIETWDDRGVEVARWYALATAPVVSSTDPAAGEAPWPS